MYIHTHTHTHIFSKVLRRVQCFIWIKCFWSIQVDAFFKVVFSSCTEYFKPNGSLQVAWALEQKHNPRQILQREQFTWFWMTDLCRLYHSQSTDKTLRTEEEHENRCFWFDCTFLWGIQAFRCIIFLDYMLESGISTLFITIQFIAIVCKYSAPHWVVLCWKHHGCRTIATASLLKRLNYNPDVLFTSKLAKVPMLGSLEMSSPSTKQHLELCQKPNLPRIKSWRRTGSTESMGWRKRKFPSW